MIDKYLGWKFNLRTRNCWTLVRAVWQELTGVDLEDLTPSEPNRTSCWLAVTTAQSRFIEIPMPVSPCIVLMQRAEDIPHIGVFIDGKVLHLRPTGVVWQPIEIATMCFPVVIYYANSLPVV